MKKKVNIIKYVALFLIIILFVSCVYLYLFNRENNIVDKYGYRISDFYGNWNYKYSKEVESHFFREEIDPVIIKSKVAIGKYKYSDWYHSKYFPRYKIFRIVYEEHERIRIPDSTAFDFMPERKNLDVLYVYEREHEVSAQYEILPNNELLLMYDGWLLIYEKAK